MSVRHVLSDVRCMLRWCEDSGLMIRAPIPQRLLPKVQERPPDRLSNEEIEAVCALPDPHGFICRLGLAPSAWGRYCGSAARPRRLTPAARPSPTRRRPRRSVPSSRSARCA
jgi:hypothetical protein